MAERDPQKVSAILQDYSETLEVLTINSKPLINDLTMAADRYKHLAAQIIEKIESRLFEVPVNQKLPLLYLLDSIMKNLRGRYLDEINTRIVAIFCHSFEKLVEPKVRISLYKLRQTWNPFIAKKKLAAIDKHIHALDPNWPITATDVTAPISPTIHVNPEFLLTGDRAGKMVSTAAVSSTSVTVTVTKTPPTKTPPTNPKPALSSNKLSTSASPTLEQRRKNVLEAQKKKKEQLKAKGSITDSPSSVSSMNHSAAGATSSSTLLDPRKVPTTSNSTIGQTAVGKRQRKKPSLSPMRERSSLSPDYDSRSKTKRRKLSPRPRSVSPMPTAHHATSARRQTGRQTSLGKRTRPAERGTEKEGERKKDGIVDILKTIDISSLMGSIERVKKETEREKDASPASLKPATSEDNSANLKVAQLPPEKKPRLEEDAAASTSPSVDKGVDVPNAAEDDDVIPKIKSSHLNLDDIPVELLPTHQEKIMKQVERQLKSGRLSEEQHSTLVKQLDQLYALQRKKENDRESEERTPPGSSRHTESLSPATESDQTVHPSLTSSDSNKSMHTDHIHVSVHGSRPPPDRSDRDFRPVSPPPHTLAPHPPPPVDHHPPTRSRPPFDRYPRHHPDHHRGPRPYRGRVPRGHRPFGRPPRHSGRPGSEWHDRQPPERWIGHEETPPPNNALPPPAQGNSDPSELFSKLVELGIIKHGEGEGKGEGEGEREGSQERGGGLILQSLPPSEVNTQIPLAIPNLTFTVATLKKPYSALVRLMYAGDPCATCGLRFRDRKTEDYSSHLDWHYKMNSRDKNLQRPRNWFLHPEDWLKFEESTADNENREPLVLERELESKEEKGGHGEGEQESSQESSCQVLSGEESEVCTVCAEQFEQFWEEVEEEWHFRDAVREEGKLYHTYCYQDAKESGSLDTSGQQPSPVEQTSSYSLTPT